MSPHAAWSTSLTADSVDCTRSDGAILLRVTHGLADVWEVRGRDTVIPGMDGQVPRNRKRNRLPIIAEGFIQGTGSDEDAQRASIVATMDAIRALMDPTQDPYTLEVLREDGSTATIEARPVNVLWGDDGIPTYRDLSCEWVAIGDDWTAGGS